MKLIIPADVGGSALLPKSQLGIIPGQRPDAGRLLIPIDVGGQDSYGQAPAPQQEAPGLMAQAADVVTGSLREVPETAALSELVTSRGVTTGSFWNDLKVAWGLMGTASDAEKKDIIAEQFPGTTFREDEKGTTIMNLPKYGERALNQPGASAQDVVGVIGDIAKYYPAAKLAGLGKSLIQKLAIGGAAGTATSLASQAGAQTIGSKQDISIPEAIESGAFQAGGELISPAFKAIKASRQAKKLGVEAADYTEALGQVKEADVLTKETKIPLFQAQKTLDPAALDTQSFVASLPGGSKKAATELKAQNQAAFSAVEDVMNQIAPPSAIETAGGKIRTLAQQAVEAKKTLRSEAASPLYEKAKGLKDVIGFRETTKELDSVIKDLPAGDPFGVYLKSLKGNLKGGLTTKKAHRLQMSIGDKISKFGEGSLGGTEKREVVKIKNSILAELDQANPDYEQARKIFADKSPAVKELEDSILGKISALDETQLKTITKRLFDPAETNPQIIAKARKIIEAQDPQAWRDITRTELERRIGSIKAVEGTTENVPGQLRRAIFGNVKQRKALFSGLDVETRKNMTYLDEALRRASMGRPGGSQTATRTEIAQELKGGVVGTFRNFLSGPLKAVAGVGEEAAFKRRVSAAANLLYDPKWQPELKKLRQIGPNSPRAAQMLDKLLKQSQKATKEFGKPAIQTTRDED